MSNKTKVPSQFDQNEQTQVMLDTTQPLEGHIPQADNRGSEKKRSFRKRALIATGGALALLGVVANQAPDHSKPARSQLESSTPSELKGEVGKEPVQLVLRPGVVLRSEPKFSRIDGEISDENVVGEVEKITVVSNPGYEVAEDGTRFYLVPRGNSADESEQQFDWVADIVQGQTNKDGLPYAEITFKDPNEVIAPDVHGHFKVGPNGVVIVDNNGQAQPVSEVTFFENEAALHKELPHVSQ